MILMMTFSTWEVQERRKCKIGGVIKMVILAMLYSDFSVALAKRIMMSRLIDRDGKL